MFEMIDHDLFGQRFQGAPRGDDLIQNLRTLVVAGNHRLHGLELASDAAQADLQGSAVGFDVRGALRCDLEFLGLKVLDVPRT